MIMEKSYSTKVRYRNDQDYKKKHNEYMATKCTCNCGTVTSRMQ